VPSPHREGFMRTPAYRNYETSNLCSPSTNWHWKDASLDGPGGPLGESGAGGPSVFALRSRDPRKPLDMQVRYVGGPEGTWLIQARDWRWRCTGGLSLVDVMNWINRCDT